MIEVFDDELDDHTREFLREEADEKLQDYYCIAVSSPPDWNKDEEKTYLISQIRSMIHARERGVTADKDKY